MDPLSTATAFATIVGLIGNFSAERRNAASANYEEFMEWLIKNNHQELVALITRSNTTATSIKTLLNEGREELIARLQSLDASLAQLATGFNGFRDIALAVYPGAELSDQALSLIEQFVDSGASKVLTSRYIDGELVLHILEGGSGNLAYSDPRFIEDDLNTLLEFELLRLDHNGRGDRIYIITRNAVRFVQGYRAGT
ncbi:hypothetical protein FHR56_003122 [Xanthomonas sacchari]|uniref:hypothetical protein n=1 Tax=unclassified Xanthomonas TaxID=2643310 RepID=UPI00136CEB8F|nr:MULTISPECIES: hypothetical protein [unclassified Xanthomonas]MBB6367957.1 hypothetical protein [Xanthomonas sp. F10]